MSSYAQTRAREIAGEFTRDEMLQLIRELRQIYYSKIKRSAKYYRQPEPKPTPRGPKPLQFITEGVFQ